MQKDGLQRMLDFLNFLDENNIHFFITQYSPDALTATLTLVGLRIEATFYVDHVGFSCFKGNEDVETDEKLLHDIIKQYHEA
jgi:hypothetical protein